MACKISIVTICLNNVNSIKATVESVINQSYSDIEYIVVDGGSKDGTMDVLAAYKGQIAQLISEPDAGLYDAINKGLKLATGEVVGLIHAGDRLFDNQIVEKIARCFILHEVDVIYGHSLLVNEWDKPVRVNKSPPFRRPLIARGWMPSHQSIYLKRHLLDQLGYYNLSMHPSSDYEFFLRYFYFSTLKIMLLDAYVLRFAMGGRSTKNYLNNLRAQPQHKDCWRVNGAEPPAFLVPLKLLRKPLQFIRAFGWRLAVHFS
jgi:glycosyltransferase involved in cell wall biosynthesis